MENLSWQRLADADADPKLDQHAYLLILNNTSRKSINYPNIPLPQGSSALFPSLSPSFSPPDAAQSQSLNLGQW